MKILTTLDDVTKIVEDIVNEYLFEINNQDMRDHLIRNLYDNLREVHSLGVTYKVICDETNNTPETLNLGQLHARVDYGDGIFVSVGVEQSVS